MWPVSAFGFHADNHEMHQDHPSSERPELIDVALRAFAATQRGIGRAAPLAAAFRALAGMDLTPAQAAHVAVDMIGLGLVAVEAGSGLWLTPEGAERLAVHAAAS